VSNGFFKKVKKMSLKGALLLFFIILDGHQPRIAQLTPY